MITICEHCGQEFRAATKRRFCSHACRCRNWELEHPGNKARRQKKYLESERGRQKQEEYRQSDSYRESQMRSLRKRRPIKDLTEFICPICGKHFWTVISTKKYCGTSCKNKAQYLARKERNNESKTDD